MTLTDRQTIALLGHLNAALALLVGCISPDVLKAADRVRKAIEIVRAAHRRGGLA